MAIWDKLKTELDRAGKAAQSALDEGKVRLEAFRTRQLADKAAQAFGYAVYRAKQSGTDLDPETYARLTATLATHEAEAARLEQQLRDFGPPKGDQKSSEPPPPSASASPATPPPTSPPPAADAATAADQQQPPPF